MGGQSKVSVAVAGAATSAPNRLLFFLQGWRACRLAATFRFGMPKKSHVAGSPFLWARKRELVAFGQRRRSAAFFSFSLHADFDWSLQAESLVFSASCACVRFIKARARRRLGNILRDSQMQQSCLVLSCLVIVDICHNDGDDGDIS